MCGADQTDSDLAKSNIPSTISCNLSTFFLFIEEMEDCMEDEDDALLKYVYKCNTLNLTQFDSN